jgi:hypothetical protein
MQCPIIAGGEHVGTLPTLTPARDLNDVLVEVAIRSRCQPAPAVQVPGRIIGSGLRDTFPLEAHGRLPNLAAETRM